jgi:hypothetical protein
MHPIVIRSQAGDAGPLTAPPQMAERFHFWRGETGRRYAFTVFAGAVPAFERYVALFVKRRGAELTVVAVGTMKHAGYSGDFDEIHVHLTADDAELEFAVEDLAALARPIARAVGVFSNLPVYRLGKGTRRLEPAGTIQLRAVPLFRRAASHSNVASRIPSVSSSFTVAST